MQPGHEAARESSIPSPSTPDLPALLLPTDGQLAIPTNEQFKLILADAEQAGRLPSLHKTISAIQSAAEKMQVAFGELRRIAVFRLQTERAIGALLAQTVCHGGDRSRSPGRILKGVLPDWVTPNQSSAYQRLATISDELFRRYLEETAERSLLPSAAGARRFAEPLTQPVAKRGAGGSRSLRMSQEVIDASMRCLGSCDVLVGSAPVDAASRLKGISQATVLRGSVLVSAGCDPHLLVCALSRGVSDGLVSQAIAILPLAPSAAWFQGLGGSRASLCFLRAGSSVLAHFGERRHGFGIVMREHGLIMDAQGSS